MHLVSSRALLSGFALIVALPAQMSGSYTVDPIGSGARNFTKLDAISFALASGGVSGPVDVAIAPGSYTGPWHLAPIPGASSTNTVTFRSPTRGAAFLTGHPMLTLATSGPLFPVDWIVIDGLGFKGIPTERRLGISLNGNFQNLEIRNCDFDNASIKIMAWDTSGALRFHHNRVHFQAGRSDIAMDLDRIDGVDFHHNDFLFAGQDGIRIAVSLLLSRKSFIWNNIFRGALKDSGSILLDLSRGSWTSVEHNTFFIQSGSKGYCLKARGLFARRCEVQNNVFVSLGTNATAVYYVSTNPFELYTAYNIYWMPGSPTPIGGMSLLQWQSQTGMGVGSLSVNPLLKNTSTTPFDLRLSANSPALGSSGSRSSFIVDDFAGTIRYPASAIGAYEGALPISFRKFGSGCVGSGGWTPAIGSTGELVFGTTNLEITVGFARGGPNVLATIIIGASNQSFRGIPLPFPIGGRCDLLVAPHIVLTQQMSGPTGFGTGSARFAFPVPNDPRLIGSLFYMQWMVTDQILGGTGLVFSDACELAF